MHRKFWVAVHRYLGLAMLLLLLVIALTGSALVFQHEIDAWLNPRLMRVEHTQPALGADALIQRVEQADPRLRVTMFPLDVAPGAAYELRVVPRLDGATGRPHVLGFDRLFIDPATAQVLGRRQWGAPRLDRLHLMPFLDLLHRRLHLPGTWGPWVTGGVALAWLAASVLGAWLTLPRATTRRQGLWAKWRPAWTIKRGASASRTTFDLHRCLGLWSLPLAAILATSGVYFSLGDEVFKPVVRLFSPVQQHPVRSLPVLADANAGRPPAFGVEEAVRRARGHLVPSARAFLPWYAIHLPRQGVYRIAFKEPDMLERAWRLRYEQVFIDDQNGALRALYGHDSGTGGERFLTWQYPLHTGRMLGMGGRIAVLLAGLAASAVALAGLTIWWSRSRARSRTGAKRPPQRGA